MNIFSIIYIINVFLRVKSEFEIIKLLYQDNKFYIPIKLSKEYNEEYFIFSTMLPIHFFPSKECSICSYKYINENDSNYYSFIQSDVSLLYYFHNLTGNAYRTNITLGTEKSEMDIIAIHYLNDYDEYKDKGRFSLSFLNYDFNTTNKTFALNLDEENAELHLGGYNQTEIIYEKNLKIFNISKTNNSLSYLYNDFWYIDFDFFCINDIKFENKKFIFDLSSDNFHIPKDFFFENANLIFPEEARCQVQPEGNFVCYCINEEYKSRFYTFKFMNKNNESIEISPDDYIFFEESANDNYCYVYIMVNYDNDYFIAGQYVMSNYYNIFDIDNGKLMLYPRKKKIDNFSKEKNFIISLVLLLAGIFLFLCCYLIYRRYFSNNQNEENENYFDENNNLLPEDFNWDEINNVDPINENNGEGTEENKENNDINGNENNNLIDKEKNENNEEINESNNILDEKKEEENNINENSDENEIFFGGRESNIIN